MDRAPLIRADALHFRPEFEQLLESEVDPRRKAFLCFLQMQSLAAVTDANAAPQSGGDITLDMRGVAALALRLFERQEILAEIFSGNIVDEDWSS
jgi:hypothetical protein